MWLHHELLAGFVDRICIVNMEWEKVSLCLDHFPPLWSIFRYALISKHIGSTLFPPFISLYFNSLAVDTAKERTYPAFIVLESMES